MKALKEPSSSLSSSGQFRSCFLSFFCCYFSIISIFICFFGPIEKIEAQTTSTNNATTDPTEARILNSIFQRWGISASDQWNISGEICSGVAIDPSVRIQDLNPGVKCDCSARNGTLCHITGLRVYATDISGTIPDELWNLTHLDDLNLAQNYLTGPISPLIGRLTRMQWLALGINALSGELPLELGLLTDLRSLGLGVNNFSGPLPPQLGNLTRVTQIYIDSCGFTGAIPSTFSNLKLMETLYASDNEFTGQIPEFIGNWSLIRSLRLEGNAFHGPIPSIFSNLTSLQDLFIGNNRLTGALPAQKSLSLQFIDLSYNELSGSFPSWINQENLQVNLVANNFTLESSNSSVLPSGLNCLQRDFQCNRRPPMYYNFSIRCGGPQLRSSDQILYEMDNNTLGPATYYMTRTGRWAVSNVGLPSDSRNPQYTGFSFSQFTNTLDSELYQTVRRSAGSLRYYGLGLENGNYTVNLHFAESIILNPPTWRSLGRRVFDIYIQGNLVFKNFDLRKEAGGSLIALRRAFPVQVFDNHLDIHLFWAGKGTCCVPEQGTYGPIISAISATPDFIPTVSNIPPNSGSGKNKRTGLIVGIVVGVVSFIAILIIYYSIERKRKQPTYEDEELLGMDARPYTFSYAELRTATDDFNPANKLGEGGFGPVYKGKLEDGRDVAIKQLSATSRQGKTQFVAEIATISAVQHRNLVRLYGCCIDGDKRLLVYEYHENRSLDKALFEMKTLCLNWPTRFEICLGVARGLAYLHEESQLRIVHRDVKASNILLDFDLKPKISDFGLAKLYDDKKTHISTKVIAGTIGYVAPEYALRGHLTEKADVYGFGIVALEIVSGRPNSNESLEKDKMYLLEWAWHLHERHQEIELVDANLLQFNEDEVKRVIGVAFLCTQTSPAARPPMSRVVAMLSGDVEVVNVTSRPVHLTDCNFNDDTSFMTNHSQVEDSPCTLSTTNMTINETPSPINDTRCMLQDIVAEGR